MTSNNVAGTLNVHTTRLEGQIFDQEAIAILQPVQDTKINREAAAELVRVNQRIHRV